jgi:DNA-binding HxlR family transcriptional regulator
MTTRDEVWDVVATELASSGKFRISDLPFDESQKATVRRTLREMERIGWVTRTTDQSPIWRLGPKAKLLLDVSEDVVAKSES